MHINPQVMVVTSNTLLAKVTTLTLLTFITLAMSGQLNIDPPNWWGDLEHGRVEVLISGQELGVVTGVTCADEIVAIERWRAASLPGHVWVELDVSGVETSKYFDFATGAQNTTSLST